MIPDKLFFMAFKSENCFNTKHYVQNTVETRSTQSRVFTINNLNVFVCLISTFDPFFSHAGTTCQEAHRTVSVLLIFAQTLPYSLCCK